MGTLHFRPPHILHPLTTRYKIVAGDYVHNFYSYAKFGGNPSMGASGQISKINMTNFLFIYTPFFSNSPTGQTAHHILTLDGSNDADSRKSVPLGFG